MHRSRLSTNAVPQITFWKKYPISAYLLLAIFLAQCLWHATNKSATYDEPGHIAISVLLWKTERSNYELGHPPLVRYIMGLPVLLLSPSLPADRPYPTVPKNAPLIRLPGSELYIYSAHFIYQNTASFNNIIFAARTANIFLGLVAGALVFLIARKLYGESAALFSLGLFTFCPNLVAHSSLATTDIGGIAFALLFFYTFIRLINDPGPRALALASLGLGGALLAKTTNIILAPLYVMNVFILWKFYPSNRLRDLPFKEILKITLVPLAVSWLMLCLAYKFQDTFTLHTLLNEDWELLKFGPLIKTLYSHAPLPDSFIKGLAYNVVHDKRGHGGFLMSNYQSFGWWYYFPLAIAFKTPTTTLLLAIFRTSQCVKNKLRVCAFEFILLTVMAVLLISAMKSSVAIGLRHILLFYPLLYILLGKIMSDGFFNDRRGRYALFGLFGFLALEVFSVSPHYLAFYNRACGGPSKGIRYLSDSNLDWGQDLGNLAKFLRKEEDKFGKVELMLSYFGTAVPQAYGLNYEPLPTVWSYPKSGTINSVLPKKEYLAISATNLQGTYFGDHNLYKNLVTGLRPIKVIGHSIYVYEVTRQIAVQEKLLQIYMALNDPARIDRQTQRLSLLKK